MLLTCFKVIHVAGERYTNFICSFPPHQRKQCRLRLIFTKTHADLFAIPRKKKEKEKNYSVWLVMQSAQ